MFLHVEATLGAENENLLGWVLWFIAIKVYLCDGEKVHGALQPVPVAPLCVIGEYVLTILHLVVANIAPQCTFRLLALGDLL